MFEPRGVLLRLLLHGSASSGVGKLCLVGRFEGTYC